MTQFAVEVVAGDGPSASPSPSADPTASASPNPPPSTSTSGTTGGTGSSTTGGTSTNLDSGSLASTGTGGIDLPLAAAAALATVGLAAFRLDPQHTANVTHLLGHLAPQDLTSLDALARKLLHHLTTSSR
ncbi:hypothetical protein RKD47_006390 [Streptomyces albogriseolus]